MAFNKPLTYGNLAVTEVISGCGLAAFSATVQTLAIDNDVANGEALQINRTSSSPLFRGCSRAWQFSQGWSCTWTVAIGNQPLHC